MRSALNSHIRRWRMIVMVITVSHWYSTAWQRLLCLWLVHSVLLWQMLQFHLMLQSHLSTWSSACHELYLFCYLGFSFVISYKQDVTCPNPLRILNRSDCFFNRLLFSNTRCLLLIFMLYVTSFLSLFILCSWASSLYIFRGAYTFLTVCQTYRILPYCPRFETAGYKSKGKLKSQVPI